MGIGYWFGERPAGYVLECREPAKLLGALSRTTGERVFGNILGTLDDSGMLRLGESDSVSIDELTRAWRGTLALVYEDGFRLMFATGHVHLFRRAAAIGRIVEGQEIADALGLADKIESAEAP